MAEEYVIKFVSEDFDKGVSTATGSTSSGGGGVASVKGGMGKLVGLGAGIAAGVQLLVAVAGETINSLLKPIMGVLKGIVKMVGELLRPLVEVVVILLRPVLAVLRPIIQMVRTMLAPFMRVAREFSAMASQQMASGASGLGAAMELSLQAAKAIIAPFVVAILGVALELVTVAVMQGLSFLISTGIEVLAKAAEHIPKYGTGIADSLRGFAGTVSGLADDATTDITNKIRGGTQSVLDGMLLQTEEDLVKAKGKFGVVIKENVTNPWEDALKAMGFNVDGIFGIAGSIPKTLASGLKTCAADMTTFVDGLLTQTSRLNPGVESRRKFMKWDYTNIIFKDQNTGRWKWEEI